MSTIFERNHYTNPSAEEVDRRGRSLNYQGIDSKYGYAGDNGFSWYSGTAQNWGGDHSIDPNTGMIRSNDGSPVGSVPWQVAQHWQSAHDQAVYQIKNRLMQSAANYGKGGLRLMQSFRPGGGAAMESGVYQNMANIQLNRAAMTQPLDYMGDYRQHAGDQAASEARKAQKQQQLIGAGVAVAAVVAGALTGGVGGALVGGLAGAGGLLGGGQKGGQSPNQSTYGQTQEAQAAGLQPQYGGMDSPNNPYGNNTGWAGTQPREQAGGTDLQRPGGGSALGAQMQQEPGQPMQQGGQMGKPKQKGAGGPQEAGGGGGSMGGGAAFADGPFAGADGNFTSTAYGAAGSQRLNPVTQTLLLRQVADRMDNDPFYDSFSMTVDIEMARRMPQAGAA